MSAIILLLLIIPAFIVFIDFGTYMINGKRATIGIADIFSYILFPIGYLCLQDLNQKNNCCFDTATFSPDHRVTIYVIILTCMANYLYCLLRSKIAPPVLEVLINSFLLLSIGLNVFIIIHLNNDSEDWILWSLGNIPIILLSIMMLIKNHRRFIEESEGAEPPTSKIEKRFWNILNAHPLMKYPLLMAICLPILFIITSILLLFGQKPDSITRAFTDTYKHGLSQLDHECEGVVCEGHYLCTIAAKGHRNFVKPIRLGIRGGQTIICNRQLLVSNAFEEFVQQKVPILHRIIRKNYDQVGNVVERYYNFFNNKLVSDIVYILMKPLEWIFVLILYCCDKNPENRIARQYTGHK